MGPGAAIQSKPVADQCDLTSSDVPKLSVVDAHGSDGYCDMRFDSNLHLIGWLLRNSLAVLKHALDNHTDDFIDILQRFYLGFAPR